MIIRLGVKLFLTKRQAQILAAQTETARSNATIEARARKLGIHKSTFHSHNTLIFYNAIEALEVLTDPENYSTFRGRLRKSKNEERIWDLTRQLRNTIKRAIA